MNIGEIVAYLSVNDAQFKRGIDSAGRDFNALASLAKTAGQVVATTFTTGSTAAVAMGTHLLKTGGGYNILQQNSRAALKVLLGGAEAVNKQMAELDAFARTSPFAKSVFIEAQQQMLGFGVEAERVVPALDAIQNAIAAQGKGAEEIGRATYALSQMKSVGAFTGQTIRELGLIGIDAANILANKMGTTGEEIKKMASRPGGIPAEEVWDPLIEGLQEKFGGATAFIKEQFTGATDRIKAAWRDTGAIIAAPFIDPDGGGKAVEWLNLVADGMRGIEKHVRAAMPVVEAAMSGTFGRIDDKLRTVNATIARFNLDGMIRSVQSLTKYEPLIAATGTALFMLGTKPIPVINGLATGMWPLVGAVTALVATHPQLRGLSSAFVEGFKPAIPVLGATVKMVADLATDLLNELAPGLLKTAEGGGKLLASLITLAPPILAILDAAVPLVGVAADLLAVVANLPMPVLAAAAAFIALRNVNLGQLATGFMDLSMQVPGATRALDAWKSGLSPTTALVVGATGAVNAMGQALKTAFISNAPLLALTALVSVVSYFAQEKAKATARIEAFKNSLDQATGAVTDNTRELVANELVAAGTAKHLDALGVAYEDYTDAILGNEDANRRVQAAINRANGEIDEQWGKVQAGKASLEGYNLATQDTRDAVEHLERTQGRLTGELKQGADRASVLAQMMGEGTDQAKGYADAIKDAADVTDRLRKAEQDLAAARGDLILSGYAAKDSLEDWTSAVAEAGGITRDHAGAIDTNTVAWRAFEEQGVRVIRAHQQNIENLQKTGASQQELNDAMGAGEKAILDTAAAMGVSADEARVLLDALGGLSADSFVISVDADGAYKTVDDLLAFVQSENPELFIDANSDPALADFMEMLGLVETTSGFFTIDANKDPALAQLLLTQGAVNTATGEMHINAENLEALRKADQTRDYINNTSGWAKIYGEDATGAGRKAAEMAINATYGHAKVYASDHTADGLAAIKNKIANTVATMRVSTQSTAADGALFTRSGVRAMAAGGVTKREPQIAPGGSYILWAEDETEGEAYIPLAQSKRSRSIDILRQVAEMFGLDLTSRTKNMADGGITVPTVEETKQLDRDLRGPLADIAAQFADLADNVGTQMGAANQNMMAFVESTRSVFVPSMAGELGRTGTDLQRILPDASRIMTTQLQSGLGDFAGWFGNVLRVQIVSALGGIQSAFTSVPSAVASSWAGIRGATREPTNYVIDTVYMSGIRTAVNAINSAVGLSGRMPAVSGVGYAAGGVLPGYTPGSDVHDFYNPMFGMLRLSGGEGILRPEVVRALGGEKTINAWNSARGVGIGSCGDRGYAGGGILDFLNKTSGGWSVNTSSTGFNAMAIQNPTDTINSLVHSPAVEYAARAGGGLYGQGAGRGMTDVAAGYAGIFAKETEKLALTGLVGAARGALGVPYVWGGSTIPPGLDCSGLVYWALMQMGKSAPRLTAAGYQGVSTPVDSPMPGDLAFWPGHVGIVTGPGQMIHAPQPGSVVSEAAIYGSPSYGRLPYDQGGNLMPGVTMAVNKTGKPEKVLTDEQWRDVAANLRGPKEFRVKSGQLDITADGKARLVDLVLEESGLSELSDARITSKVGV